MNSTDIPARQETKALAFAQFPCAHDAKEPALPGDWRGHSTTDAGKWWAWDEEGLNRAIDCERSEITVIDLDGGAVGEATWARLQTEHGQAPDTYEVRTPRGGRHIYFKGLSRSSVQRLGPKVDSRSRGGYVLAPPSIVAGRPYTVIRDLPLADLPPWILDALARRDLPENVRRGDPTLLANVTGALACIKLQPEDYETYRDLMFAVQSADVADASDEEVWDAWDAWASGQHGYDQGENRGHWEAADARGGISVGTLYKAARDAGYRGRTDLLPTVSPVDRFKDYTDTTIALQAADAKPDALVFEGLGDLLACEPQPVAELVPDLIEKGIFQTLSGVGGTNKSRLGFQWGLCIGTGTPIMGRKVEPATFVFLSCEDSRDEIVRRAHAISRKLHLPADAPSAAVRYVDRRGRNSPLINVRDAEQGDPIEVTDFGKQFVAALRAMPGHKFLLVDSTYNAARFLGRAKINETSVQECIGWFDGLCESADCTVLSLWHPSQAGSEREDGSGWSVAWHNTPRGRLSIKAASDHGETFELSCKKRNHGKIWPSITLHWTEGALLPIGDVASGDMEAKFRDACVDLAVILARQGTPIKQRGDIPLWALKEVEHSCGRRPTQKAFREALNEGMRDCRLRWHTDKNGGSGFYPFEMDNLDQLAAEASERRRLEKTAALDRAQARNASVV